MNEAEFRGLVAEYGLVAPKHLGHLRAALPRWLEDAENGLTRRFRRLVDGLRADLVALDKRVAVLL
jgi:transposase